MQRYLSIDIEASGPWPGLFSLCSIGAVPVARFPDGWTVERERGFYGELQPLEGAGEIPEATAVHGLSAAYLGEHGEEPGAGMRRFADYLAALGPAKSAAWPASFDHPWIGWYLQRFVGHNPLGHSGFDMASFAMGLMGKTGRNATFRALEKAGYRPPSNPNPHHALHDAIEQADTLAWLLNYADRSPGRTH